MIDVFHWISPRRQPFDDPINVDRWTFRDEAERLDRLATLISQAGLALAAGATGAGFSLDVHRGRVFAFVVAAVCAGIGFVAAASLGLNPMTHVTSAIQEARLKAKLKLVRAAGFALFGAVPFVGGVIGLALFGSRGSLLVLSLATAAIEFVGLIGLLYLTRGSRFDSPPPTP